MHLYMSLCLYVLYLCPSFSLFFLHQCLSYLFYVSPDVESSVRGVWFLHYLCSVIAACFKHSLSASMALNLSVKDGFIPNFCRTRDPFFRQIICKISALRRRVRQSTSTLIFCHNHVRNITQGTSSLI